MFKRLAAIDQYCGFKLSREIKQRFTGKFFIYAAALNNLFSPH